MKRVRIISIVVSAVMLVTVLFTLSGCADQYPKKVEGDVWTYYILKDGTVALMGLNPDAVPEDGILYIPDKIDKRKITSFAVGLGGGFADMWTVPYMQKTTVAEGVPVSYFFWAHGGRIIEFESKTAEEISYFRDFRRNIIVPDGCRDVYVAALETQREGLSEQYVILEKTESLDTEWVVDENGLLKAYFGLEPDHFVLPNGIKKIDADSFYMGGGGCPKTIVLNEDLEEIGSYGLRIDLDEITIPKSVKYLDDFSVYAKKVYLYRSTVCHEQALRNVPEIIYLD